MVVTNNLTININNPCILYRIHLALNIFINAILIPVVYAEDITAPLLSYIVTFLILKNTTSTLSHIWVSLTFVEMMQPEALNVFTQIWTVFAELGPDVFPSLFLHLVHKKIHSPYCKILSFGSGTGAMSLTVVKFFSYQYYLPGTFLQYFLRGPLVGLYNQGWWSSLFGLPRMDCMIFKGYSIISFLYNAFFLG